MPPSPKKISRSSAAPARELHKRGRPIFALSSKALNSVEFEAEFDDERAGARVVFEGRVRNRNEGKAVTGLEYEAYPRMALREGERVVAEALKRPGVVRAECVHRLGRLGVGDLAVWVAVLAEHREEAFAACRYIIDEVKSRVPIWKKEHYSSGDSSWVSDGSSPSPEGSRQGGEPPRGRGKRQRV